MTKQGGWPASGFGIRLRELREEREWTQAELAKKAGCHTMTVTKLERGVQEPAWPLVLAFCRALGVPCTSFYVKPAGQPTPRPRPRGRPRKHSAE